MRRDGSGVNSSDYFCREYLGPIPSIHCRWLTTSTPSPATPSSGDWLPSSKLLGCEHVQMHKNKNKINSKKEKEEEIKRKAEKEDLTLKYIYDKKL